MCLMGDLFRWLGPGAAPEACLEFSFSSFFGFLLNKGLGFKGLGKFNSKVARKSSTTEAGRLALNIEELACVFRAFQVVVLGFVDRLGLRLGFTYSLHCSSLFWFIQFYIKDPKR